MAQPATYGFPDETARLPRPATLNIGGWLGVVVGLLSIVGPITMITMGKDSVRALYESTLADLVGADVANQIGTTDADISDAYNSLVVKAVVGLVIGVAILVLALIARGGSNGARIGLVVALVLGLCAGSGLQLANLDALPSVSVAIAGLTPLLSIITIVLVFLPATNRYVASRKSAGPAR
jgi:hypothetical protein